MKYEGKLYGKVGRKLIPLQLTSQDVDVLVNAHEEVIHLVRDWSKDPPPDWNILSLKDAVLYVLCEEESAKRDAMRRAKDAEERTAALLGVDAVSEPWREQASLLASIRVDAKALLHRPAEFCQIIAKELVERVKKQLHHF